MSAGLCRELNVVGSAVLLCTFVVVLTLVTWCPPLQGFNPAEVPDKYGSKLYFWNWKERVVTQEIELGADGLVPLEVNFISGQGRVGSAYRHCGWCEA